MAAPDRRVEIAQRLFAGWSSGDPDAPEDCFHPQGVLMDVASGRFEGWPAIRGFFASGLQRTHNLTLIPDQFWANDDGLAVHYVMSGEVVNPASYGPEFVGRRWSVEVMSYLRFEGDLVVYEADFHDKGSRAKSLGIGL
jgi:ketosteroid isomerase-like protein